MRRLRSTFREVRAFLVTLGWIAAAFLLVFLAGALVGTFAAGVKIIAGMAPDP